MDEMKMAVSHDQGQTDPDMTPDEAKAIVAHYGAKLPHELWDNLRDPEKKTLLDAIPVTADTVPAVPGMGTAVKGAIGLGAKALQYAPKMGGIARAAKGGVGMYAGYEGAQMLGKALGLPPALTNILSMVGGGIGGHFTGGGAVPEGAPEAPPETPSSPFPTPPKSPVYGPEPMDPTVGPRTRLADLKIIDRNAPPSPSTPPLGFSPAGNPAFEKSEKFTQQFMDQDSKAGQDQLATQGKDELLNQLKATLKKVKSKK